MTNISEHVAQLLSEEWKSLPISVDERQFKHFELLPVYLRDFIWDQVQHRFKSQLNASNAHWVQWDDHSVRTKWESFITAAMETIEVPREELVEIGQEFVQTWIPILVQPNEQLVDFLYGDKVELEAHELEKRCEQLLFFPELKRLLPRYLERKELHLLSKVRASQIIQQLLSKLTESYDWGRWEQELETLYQLCMSVELPKSLLVEYFDDRSKNDWAIKLRGDGDLRVNEVIDLIKKMTLVEVELEPEINTESLVEVEPEPKQEILSNLDPDEDSLFNRPFLETEEVDEVMVEGKDGYEKILLTNAGFGYTEVPTITISGGGGTGAAATCSINTASNGVIRYVVNDGGVGYGTVPVVTVAAPAGGVAADRAIGIASIGIDATSGFNEVKSIFVSNAGAAYTSAPTVTIANPETISGIGTYQFNEIVQGMRSGTQARVKNWDYDTKILKVGNVGIGTTKPFSRLSSTQFLATSIVDPTTFLI